MENRNKNKGRKLVSLCVLGMVLFMLFSLVPFTSVVPADAAFSSITITDVKPTELHPGETREVTVTVRNDGGMEARDIRLAFQGTETVSLVGPTVVHISTIDSWCWKEVKITVHVKEGAPNGVYPVPVTCKWRGYYFDPTKGYVATNITEAQLDISFNVVGKGVIKVGDVTTDPAHIRPGDKDVEIKVFIENSGGAVAKDIEARLICKANFKCSRSETNRSYIGRLNSGDSKEAIFYMDVADNIESDTYSIPLQIRYKDMKGGEHEVMREINILVGPKPKFVVVSFYTEPANISAGDTSVRLHVRVKNVGSEKAESASVRITDEAGVPFNYDVKSAYVGNLKVCEEREAILKFDVDKDALPKAYPQGIEIRCTGDRDLGDDNVYTFDKQIQLGVSSLSSGGFSIPGFEVLFALIALFVVFVLLLRRKRV